MKILRRLDLAAPLIQLGRRFADHVTGWERLKLALNNRLRRRAGIGPQVGVVSQVGIFAKLLTQLRQQILAQLELALRVRDAELEGAVGKEGERLQVLELRLPRQLGACVDRPLRLLRLLLLRLLELGHLELGLRCLDRFRPNLGLAGALDRRLERVALDRIGIGQVGHLTLCFRLVRWIESDRERFVGHGKGVARRTLRFGELEVRLGGGDEVGAIHPAADGLGERGDHVAADGAEDERRLSITVTQRALDLDASIDVGSLSSLLLLLVWRVNLKLDPRPWIRLGLWAGLPLDGIQCLEQCLGILF